MAGQGLGAAVRGELLSVVGCAEHTMSEHTGAPAAVDVPPVARKIPKIDIVHGERREDDYVWLRQKDDPEVVTHLRAENAYTGTVMKPTEMLQGALYDEMLGRIKEDDQTVPYRRGGHFYYSRTEPGKQYPIFCRKAGSLEAPEEVTLDLNVLAEGHPYLGLGAVAVSDDGHRLAYTTDVTGARELDRIEKVASVAWDADGETLFYVTEDAAKRPYRLYRHRLGATADDLVYEEPDALFNLGVERSRSKAYLFASSASFTTTEIRYLPAREPAAPWQVLVPREKDHEYHVGHGGALFYIRSNGGGRRNFRLVAAPVEDPRPARWTELIPHREDVMLEDVEVFAEHYVAQERQDGLIGLRVTALSDGASHRIQFAEPAYDVASEANAEFRTSAYRFRYQSLITPPSVFDYDVVSRERTLLKQTEVLGGYDPLRYRTEREHAAAPDGTRIPISRVCRADTQREGSYPPSTSVCLS